MNPKPETRRVWRRVLEWCGARKQNYDAMHVELARHAEELECDRNRLRCHLENETLRADALMEGLERERNNECEWEETEDGNWETQCENMHVFLDGGPSANRHVHCPYCGGRIDEIEFEEG